MPLPIRASNADDIGFLEDMLVEAATWRGEAPNRDAVLSDPHIRRYLSGWGRDGDTALVATDRSGRAVGAAWFRFFTEDEPAFGFIDEEIPEVSVAVVATHRRRGVGSALMSALLEVADGRGIEALSLSVEPDNPAVRLYERLGFRTVSIEDGALTMLIELHPREEPQP